MHLAAVTSVLRSIQDPVETYRTNVAVTATLHDRARNRGVAAFLLASTNAVVGNVGRKVITEQTPARPLTPYGGTKAAAEMLLSYYSASYGVAGCALPFSQFYGPGMGEKDSFFPPLMPAARARRGGRGDRDGHPGPAP